jgi:ribose/xylose/arabinose/galactoside ABC-type transport system permease subunit
MKDFAHIHHLFYSIDGREKYRPLKNQLKTQAARSAQDNEGEQFMSKQTNTSTLDGRRNFASTLSVMSKDYMSVVGIILLAIIFSIGSYVKNGEQYFMTISNWKNIMLQSSTVAIVALGQSIILLTGNFDLSLGRMVAMISCVGAVLMKNVGMDPNLVILIMFGLGALIGAFNGFMTAYVRIPAFIATLGTQYICFGVAKLLTQATPIPNMPESIGWLGRGYIFDNAIGKVIPISVIMMLGVYIIAQFVTSKTKTGRNIYAVGGSPEAAFFSGINVKRYYFGTFVLAGLLCAFGGLILMSRLNSVAITNGQNYEFDAVIGSIIGGIALAGGKGRVIGTMFGCIFLITMFNGFSQLGVDPFVQDVLKGVVLVAAITLDVVRNRKKS